MTQLTLVDALLDTTMTQLTLEDALEDHTDTVKIAGRTRRPQ